MTDAQLAMRHESSNGFRETFSRIMDTAPALSKTSKILKASWLDTPLGPMIAIADEKALYLLEFVERSGLEHEIKRLRQKTKAVIVSGVTPPINSIEHEITQYFKGKLTTFKTPLFLLGSPFQKQVWEALRKIPSGATQSYADLAKTIDRPTACRAVAQANSTNQLAIVIPCHRVINSNGALGGYAGGVSRKQWLLDHEKNCKG